MHFVAEELRRRGVAGPAPARAGTTTTGSARCPSASTRRGASTSAGRSRRCPTPRAATTRGPSTSRQPLHDALHAMGVDMEEVSQTERYEAGHYRDAVLHGGRRARRDRGGAGAAPHQGRDPEPENEQEAAALADSVARRRRAARHRRPGPVPVQALLPRLRPRHRRPSRRTTTRRPSSPTPATSTATPASPTCHPDFEGKLVWKVDWPMRWAFEHVDFEPAGIDHATPGSSFTVGHELVETIFGMPRPAWFGYGFVGFAGVQKMSSSAGGAPTAEDALRDPRGADPALALRAPQPAAGLQHRLRRRGRAAVRRVGRARPQGRRPRPARRAGARLRAGRPRPSTAGRAADARRSSCRSGCCRRSPT